MNGLYSLIHEAKICFKEHITSCVRRIFVMITFLTGLETKDHICKLSGE